MIVIVLDIKNLGGFNKLKDGREERVIFIYYFFFI